MTEKPAPKPKTKEEREAEENAALDKLAEKLAARLHKTEKPTEILLGYSVCPICGYMFKTQKEDEDSATCPGGCGFTGQTVKIRHDKT